METYKRPATNDNDNIITPGESIIKEIKNESNTLLLFTIDNHGSMGLLAERYFFQEKETPEITNKKN